MSRLQSRKETGGRHGNAQLVKLMLESRFGIFLMFKRQRHFCLLLAWHVSVADVASSHAAAHDGRTLKTGCKQQPSHEPSVLYATTYSENVFPSPNLHLYFFFFFLHKSQTTSCRYAFLEVNKLIFLRILVFPSPFFWMRYSKMGIKSA